MKKYILDILIASYLSFSAFAGINDALIIYRSIGPDKYADGSLVKDGEAYALVYTKSGSEFEGFNEDASCKGTNNETVIVAPLAKNHRCPPTLFQLDESYVSPRKNGKWSVHLLDTRDDNGNLTIVHTNGFVVMPKVRCWSISSISVNIASTTLAAKNTETNTLCTTEWVNGIPYVPIMEPIAEPTNVIVEVDNDDSRGPLPIILTTNDIDEVESPENADNPEIVAEDEHSSHETISEQEPIVDVKIPVPTITALEFDGDIAILNVSKTKADYRYYVMFTEDLRKKFKKTSNCEVPRYDDVVLKFKINMKNKKSGFFKIYVDKK